MTLYVHGFSLDHGHPGMSPSEAAEQHRIEIRARSEAQHREAGVKPRKVAHPIRTRPAGSRCIACVVVPVYVLAIFAIVGWLMWPTLVGWWLTVEGWL